MAREIILRSHDQPTDIDYDNFGQYAWCKLNELGDDSVCLIEASTNEHMTVAELKTRGNSIAVALIERGINKTDKIAFSGQNSLQHLVLRFATFFMGNTFMPLSPTFEKYEVEQEIRSADITVLFSSAESIHKFNELFANNNNENKHNVKLVVIFDGKHDKYVTYEQLLEEGRDQTLERIPHFDVKREDTLFCVHTSGTTGKPKCAIHSHRSIINSTMDWNSWLGSSCDSPQQPVIAILYPLGHVSGTCSIPMQIMRGYRVVLFGVFDEEFMFQCIEKYRISVLPAFPHFGRRLVEGELAQRYDLSSLTTMMTSGAAFPGNIVKAIIAKYGLKFREAYGMTEYLLVTRGSNTDEEYIPGNTGQVSPGSEVKVVDLNTGESLGPGVDGEICVRGIKSFSGYFNDEKASREAFDENGWYRSGDIGHYDHKQRFFITDRLKEVIRIGVDNHYINISPVEIEQYLLTHKAVAEVAVVGVNNRTGTHWPRAYVIRKEGQTVSGEDIQQFVSDTLAYTKQLKGGVKFVDRIQRTSIGKVDRKYYRNLVKDVIIE